MSLKIALAGLAAALTLTPAPALASAPVEPTPAAVDAYLREALEATGVPGLSVVVTRGDKVVHAAGYGEDSEGRPVTAATPMRVASVSKSFTAMAVLTLVEQGKIALDEPVAGQLPGFRMADPRHTRITVRQLLNQTSGLSDSSLDIGDLESASSLADYTARLAEGRLAADPGSRYAYCNVNYDLAARLVETASGRPFDAYMKDRVFGPLGMTGSAVSAQAVRPADGFVSVYGMWLPRPEASGFLDGSGSGAVITTAADMGRWLIAQNGAGRPLVKKQSLETMHKPGVHGYGMGWSLEEESGLLVHSGNLFTYNAVEAVSPKTGYGFAVMTNGASLYDPTYDIMRGLAAMSEGRAPAALGGDRQLYDLVLGLLAVVAAGLGVMGVLRARRWASRRSGRPWWRIALRLAPVLLPVLLFAFYPDWVSVLLNGRYVTWEQLTYFPASLSITLLAAALAGLLTAVARICVLCKLTRYANSRRSR
ncbi:serine hydrolase domain-containing protein [Nonomuraea sp. NPDC049646]|uniref:serine hydrolase domain-containing protein n=1 Tax=unclassified Nonomuraea TaxID=2593643 RepID=UPI0037BA5222